LSYEQIYVLAKNPDFLLPIFKKTHIIVVALFKAFRGEFKSAKITTLAHEDFIFKQILLQILKTRKSQINSKVPNFCMHLNPSGSQLSDKLHVIQNN
jgi:hypothetical protein